MALPEPRPLDAESLITEIERSLEDWRKGTFSSDEAKNAQLALEHISWVTQERSV